MCESRACLSRISCELCDSVVEVLDVQGSRVCVRCIDKANRRIYGKKA